jgi:CPA1 family monovalent cation:H+ antiporter
VLRPTRQRLPASWSVVLTWGGLRGALSMVLALALPAGLPHRDFLVTTTFGVVVLSILMQGLTMAPLLRRLGIVRVDKDRAEYERLRARVRMLNAAIRELDSLAARRAIPPSAVETLRADYDERLEQAEKDIRDLKVDLDRFRAGELQAARRHLLVTEKDDVLESFRRGDLNEDVTNRLLSEIDTRLVEVAEGAKKAT